MSLTPIQFAGMASLEADELVSLQQAQIAENCYLDDDTIRSRNGYRALTAAPLAASGATQGLWRFRPSPLSARTVACVAGTIYQVTDPASEITQGTSTTVSTAFGATANVSAAQLGRYLYLCADDGSAMQRMDSGFTLSTLGTLPKGVQPTFSLSTLSITKFASLAAAGTLTSATSAVQSTDYYKITPTVAGGGVSYDFGADQNWTSTNWLMVVVAPPTQSAGSGTITISVSTSAGLPERIGEISDSPGTDGPCVVFCPLSNLTAATRAAARKIQLVNSTNINPYIVHGVMAIPSAPGVGPQKYRVTFQNSTTKQESAPTDDLSVSYAGNTISIPQFHAVVGHYTSWSDKGQMSADPDAMPKNICYNKGGGAAIPSKYEFASIPTFSGAIPVGDQFANADTVRLWRLTQTGWRLVKAVVYGAAITTYSITDDTGNDTLTHDIYIASGTAPTSFTCLTARAQRLIGASENRIYISSFVPTASATSIYPQFPDIPFDDSSGWSFDIAPSNVEQVQWLGDGDALYILTNEAAYVMSDLTPNSVPQKAYQRGCLGRRAACWAEQELFYAAHDGIFSIYNRYRVDELSQSIQRMYISWFAPDASVVVSYQNRRLLVTCNGKYLRYDFRKERWTRGYTTDTFLYRTNFRDPAGTVQNLWYLDANRNIQRWQPGDVVGSANAALTDNGAVIPAWIYQTGFEFTPSKARIRSIFLDTTGPVMLSVHTSMEDLDGRVKEFRKTEHQEPCWADLTAYKYRINMIGGSQVRRLLWERVQVSAEGGN